MQHEPRTARPDAGPEPIAIVGIGLRLPGGAESPEEFGAFLEAGRSGIRTVPEDRWDVAAFRPESPDDKGKIITTSGGFLDRIDLFDASFFNISPKEARYIDPQQRMVLETAWHALEHSNIDPTPLRHGNGGVYMGISSFDYALRMGELPYPELDGHLAAGCTIFSVAGRLSYFLGWRGPSVSVDSACSSSLSALHMAVQGLRAGECDIALSGGVNAVHHPSFMVMFSNGQMLAADGRCKTFDDSADGYSRGEGCAIVVLKRLADAQRDGDTVLALIRGTAIGQDGDSAGLTVPHGPAQELAIRNALAAARLDPGDIQYVEAHGTGTPLGDPIELGAINGVFASSHSATEPLLVGSVKTNIGHLEPASGIVGLVKTVLQLRSGTIYPHLNLTEPSHRIPWDAYPVAVPTSCLPWRASTRRAVVNSFGFAGTIAVAVLEQAPVPAPVLEATAQAAPETSAGGLAPVLTVSAKNAAGLQRQIESYQRFVDASPDLDVARLCYTSNVGRAHLPHRLAGVATSRSELLGLLADGAKGVPAPPGIRKVAFLFSGQGTQYAGMGASLYQRFPVFAENIDECGRLFAPWLPESVRDLILGTAADPSLINQTGYTQPALFSFEYALAQLWLSWGVVPSVMLGHSIGEVTAAAVAGMLSLADAVTLVAARSRAMQSVRAAGGMAAVALPAEDILPLLADSPRLALAAINAPGQCVISGAAKPLAEMVAELRARGVRVDELAVSHAFHSPLMTEAFGDFRQAISGLVFRQPGIPLISNVTGTLGRLADLGTPDYWVRHIGEPVRFMDGIRAVEERGRHAFVEIGPSGTLIALARGSVAAGDHRWVPSVRRRDPRNDAIDHGLAELYSAGVPVSWPRVHAGRALPKTRLPGYAFERKRYWLPTGSGTAGAGPDQEAGTHPLLGRPESTGHQGHEFSATYAIGRPALLTGHDTDAGPVVPAAAYVEILLALLDAVHGNTRGVIRDLRLLAPLPLPSDGTVTMRTRLRPGGLAEITSGPEGEQLHATALLTQPAGETGADPELRALADAPGPAEETASAEDVYTDLASAGRRYGDRYRLLGQVSRHAGGVVTADVGSRPASAAEHFPADVLECALLAVIALDDDGPGFAPVSAGGIQLFTKPRGAALRVVARVTAEGPDRLADIMVLDGALPVISLRDVRFSRPGRPDERSPFLHRLAWLRRGLEPEPRPLARHVLVLRADPARLSAAAAPGVRLRCLAGATELAGALRDSAGGEPVTDVCWLWRSLPEPMSVTRMRAECEDNYQDLLAALAALRAASMTALPRLWLVTEGAQWLPGDRPGSHDQLPAATLWGFGHVLLNEDARLRTTLLDLPAGGDPAVLARELQAASASDFQIAYRGSQRYVRRLLAGQATPAWGGGFEVRAPQVAGSWEVRPEPGDDVVPGPGQIQVLVHSAAVTCPAPAAPGAGPEQRPVLGSGCSGTVAAVGAGAGFAVGDPVIVSHPGTLRRTITVPAAAATALPAGADLELAAALPAAHSPAAAAPIAAFSLDEAGEALACARARTGPPPVVTLRPGGDAADLPAPRAAVVRPDRTYLITGLGGLALVTAHKLADLGARHLVLASRSGIPSPEASAALTALGERCDVAIRRANLAAADEVAELVAGSELDGAPLGGIVHAAGAAGKSLIASITWPAIDEQLQAQAYGGWLLHEATQHLDLDFFIVHSSVAAVIGGATQAHYAAAFAFLDSLVTWRARQGLPGMALNWGMWARVGMSARLESTMAREVERTGILFFSPARALRTLWRLMRCEPAAHYVAGALDWDRLASLSPLDNALYARVTSGRSPLAAEGEAALDLAALAGAPGTERLAVIDAFVRDSVAAALHADEEEDVDPAAEFIALGMDSLMAVELKSRLESAFRIALPASLTFDYPSPRHLTEFINSQLTPAGS